MGPADFYTGAQENMSLVGSRRADTCSRGALMVGDVGCDVGERYSQTDMLVCPNYKIGYRHLFCCSSVHVMVFKTAG